MKKVVRNKCDRHVGPVNPAEKSRVSLSLGLLGILIFRIRHIVCPRVPKGHAHNIDESMSQD